MCMLCSTLPTLANSNSSEIVFSEAPNDAGFQGRHRNPFSIPRSATPEAQQKLVLAKLVSEIVLPEAQLARGPLLTDPRPSLQRGSRPLLELGVHSTS